MAASLDQFFTVIRQRMEGAGDQDEALLGAVQATCETWRIPYGEIWRRYPERPVVFLKDAWYLPELDFSEFVEASRRFALAPGVGLAGRVWESRQYEVIKDLRSAPEFSRQEMALAVGFRSIVGLPILCGADPVAVLEFFMFKPDRHLIGSVAEIANVVGGALSEQPEMPRARREPADPPDSFTT